ncbi:MAG: CPBP family glutamic-type intramembrane protease, partial [Cyanobacteria bacterium P01_F01_bin.86]
YLQNNIWKSFGTSPFHVPQKAWLLVPFFIVIALATGFRSGLMQVKLISSNHAIILPLILFVFPSLPEEAFFRGILIPRETIKHGRKKVVQIIGWSTFLFVVWHPANALLFNHSAIPLFFSLPFLLIVTALGITCGYSYVVSKSIWVPVIIHWATVTVWALFLDGGI